MKEKQKNKNRKGTKKDRQIDRENIDRYKDSKLVRITCQPKHLLVSNFPGGGNLSYNENIS